MSLDVELERVGPSYVVDVNPIDVRFVFRNVTVGSELRADVAVSHVGTRLLRSSTTLTLTGRRTLAREAAQLDGVLEPDTWLLAVHRATEAVLDAEEATAEGIDLRYADPGQPGSGTLLDEFLPATEAGLVLPRSAGKSTVLRAAAASIASGRTIIPTLRPRITGDVLYVVGEDPEAAIHASSLDEIARGAGISRATFDHAIRLVNTHGRPLAAVERAVAEQAADAAVVFLDSLQALLGRTEGDMRDRDSRFWDAVAVIGKPTFTAAHPNRADRKGWNAADGSPAGTDVHGDRMRCLWTGRWQDDDSTLSHYVRRYTLQCVKWSHGPKFAPVSFAMDRTFKAGDGWTLRFTPSEELPPEAAPVGRPATSAYTQTLAAWRDGARTPAELAKALGIDYDTARMRLKRFGDQFAEDGAS